MSATYLTTQQLSERIHYDARTIRNRLKDLVLLEGMHYIRPFGGRKILFIWESIERDMRKMAAESDITIPMASGAILHGKIRVRPETGRLVFDFHFLGVRCREHSALPDNPANRRRMEKALAKIEAEIAADTFDYARCFPGSRRLRSSPPAAWSADFRATFASYGSAALRQLLRAVAR